MKFGTCSYETPSYEAKSFFLPKCGLNPAGNVRSPFKANALTHSPTNDIMSGVGASPMLLFADDTKLYRRVTTLEDHRALQDDIGQSNGICLSIQSDVRCCTYVTARVCDVHWRPPIMPDITTIRTL